MKLLNKETSIGAVGFVQEENNKLWTVSGLMGIAEFKGDSLVFWSCKKHPYLRISAMAIDSAGDKWLGSSNGLYKYENKELISLVDSNKLFGLRVSSMCVWKDYLVIGTRDNRVLLSSKDTLVQLRFSDGLGSDFVNVVKLDLNRLLCRYPRRIICGIGSERLYH